MADEPDSIDLVPFYEGDLTTLISDFTSTFNIVSVDNQTRAKKRYEELPERLKQLVNIDNPFLPFYIALAEQDEEDMHYDFREGNPHRYLNYIHWILQEQPQY